MTQEQIVKLFTENSLEINKLNIGTGSMIKAFILGLESNGPVYVRLNHSDHSGHKIGYEHLQGDAQLIDVLGRALGLKVKNNTLEARHA
jgi:hypothetical protein